MRALVYDGNEVRLRKDYPDPTAASGEAVIQVSLAGICSTDLEVARGYMGFTGVMGHEFVGTVLAGPHPWQGRRAVGEINCVCGRCRMCRSGLANHCTDRTVIGIDGRDGALAEKLALPVRNLHEVPEAVSDEQATFVEPLAAACQLTHQVSIGEGTEAVVLGDGRLGQLCARVLHRLTGRLVLVGRHPHKLEAAEKAGIQAVESDEFVSRGEADLVVEATGSPEGLTTAMRAVRPRGTIVLKSTTALGAEANLAPLVVDEITVVGSRCGPFPEALDLLARGEIDVAPLISATLPLSAGAGVLTEAGKAENIKVLVDVRR